MDEIEFVPLALDQLEGDAAKSLAYWRDVAGDREMPSWRAFDLMKIPHTIVRTTHVVDIEDGATDFRFRFWGTGSTEIHNQELTGKYLSELYPPKLGQLAVKSVQELIKRRHPIAMTSRFLTPNRPEKFQVILRLPLSEDGQRVTQAVSITEFPQGRYYSREAIEKYDKPSGD